MKSTIALSLTLLAGTGVNAVAQCPLGPVVHPDDGAESASSLQVAESGGALWLFAGQPDATNPQTGIATGAVHVYRRAHSTWLFVQELFPAAGSPNGDFGRSVDADEGLLIVGAPSEGIAGQGDAYLFELIDGMWTERQTLSAEPGSSGFFGTSVAIDANYIAIGEPLFSPFGTGRGQVQIYRVSSGGNASHDETLQPEEANDGGLDFGSAVDVYTIDSSRVDVIVAGPTVGTTVAIGSFAGAAFVFGRATSGTWYQKARFGPPESLAGGEYATDVAFADRDLAVVGAPGVSVDGLPEAGVVQFIKDSVGTSSPPFFWELAETLTAANPVANGNFGRSVEAERPWMVVSEPAPLGTTTPNVSFWFFSTSTFSSSVQTALEYAAESAIPPASPTSHALAFDANELEVLSAPLSGANAEVIQRVKADAFGSDPGDDGLFTDVDLMPLDIGGTQCLKVFVGQSHAGMLYWLLGTSAGTEPGLPIGTLQLPLNVFGPKGNIDPYADYALDAPSIGAPPLVNSFGILDESGCAVAQFQLPQDSPAELAGLTLHHSAIVLDPIQGAVVRITGAKELHLVAQLSPEVEVGSIEPDGGYFVCSTTCQQSGLQDFTVTLDPSPGPVPITSYEWYFGGDPSGAPDTVTLEPTVTETFVYGEYSCTVRAIAQDGSTAEASFEIVNHSEPTAIPEIVSPPPYLQGDTITLSGAESVDNDGGSIEQFSWSLAEGIDPIGTPIGSTTEADFEWTIPADLSTGSYTIRLSVIDDDGESSGNLGTTSITILGG